MAILNEVLDMLVEVGYDRLSVDRLAERTGIAKTTIYRRYPNKAALVSAAVDRPTTPGPAVPTAQPTDLRTVLSAVVGWLSDDMTTHGVGVLNAMFAGMRADPVLADAMRHTLHQDRDKLVGLLTGSTITDRGSLEPAYAELVAEVAPAMVLRRLTVDGLPCDQAFRDHVVDDVLVPLASRH